MKTLTLTQKTIYHAIADIVFITHLLLVVLVAIGWIFPTLFYFSLTTMFLTVLSELIFGYCVLSKWEFGIRRKLNPTKEYDTSCIMHYGRALFDLKPRVQDSTPRSFFKKNSFLFMLLALSVIAISFQIITT